MQNQPRVLRKKPAEIIVNEIGQKVRVYDWTDYQHRLGLRKVLTRDVDLNGKTLVIKHTWGVGDILYSTPALYGLKKKFPNCNIRYISVYPDILEGNPYVDQIIHFLDYDAYSELADSMVEDWYWLDYDVPLKGGFDYKVNLRSKPQLNEFMVSLLRKDPSELLQDERDFVNQASSSVISRYRMIALDMYCQHAFIGPDDLTDAERTVYYYPQEHELAMARRLLEPIREKGFKIITLMPHASTMYKDYPHWKKVVELCPQSYYWLILDTNMRSGEPWIGPNIFNLSGAFKIRQSAAVVIEGDLNCSSDTGLLYCKASRGGKCVVTYGPHEPEPFLHYFPTAHGLRIPKLESTEGMVGMCSTGCFIDTESCHTKGDPAPCLQELAPEIVAGKIMELLEK
jgi:ADP-heptose:LPS heptosyltransferase